MKKVAFILGTRPEVIKLAPVILKLQKVKNVKTILISTGQHDELLKDALATFNLKPDIDLKIMKTGQSLSYILSKSIARLEPYLKTIEPDTTIIQGDASSAFAGALVSFYHKIPVVHIEAGCRSHEIYEPFPEEVNRKLIAAIASWHFPATKEAQQNLIREGHDTKRIFLVGSTEPDAMDWILKNTLTQSVYKIIPTIKTTKQIVVITTHRRESWGKPLADVFLALRHIVKHHPATYFIYSIHPNPLVLQPAREALSGLKNLMIIPHIATVPFVHLVGRASLLLTDSGGIQVQAGALGKPVMILRNVTEWPEIIENGIGRLVGTDKESIISTFEDYMDGKWPKKIPSKPTYPKGAVDKIVKIITTKILA